MSRLQSSAVLELPKPINWLAPIWAWLCGAVSSGFLGRWGLAVVGAALAGPLICATTQAFNDWFDRHVDASKEPGRPIPFGLIPGRGGLYAGCFLTGLSIAVAVTLGPRVVVASIIGLALAFWAHSAPSFRLKRNGWWGNSTVAICFEGLPWFMGAAALASSLQDSRVILFALLFSFGAHGIMTLNHNKAIEVEQIMGLRWLPFAPRSGSGG
jgi:chlorophyll/bacteriochlorophyll a synthase